MEGAAVGNRRSAGSHRWTQMGRDGGRGKKRSYAGETPAPLSDGDGGGAETTERLGRAAARPYRTAIRTTGGPFGCARGRLSTRG